MSNERQLVIDSTAPGPDLASLAPDVQALVLKLAKELAKSPTVSDLWEPGDATSYWILLVSGTHRAEHLQIAKELLTWSAFSARSSSRVLCIQSSDVREFAVCASHFGAAEYPCLFLGTAPTMSTHVGLPKAVLQAITSKDGGLHDFLTETHTALIRGDSLENINQRLLKDRTKRFAEVVYRELRSIVSFKGSAEWKA